MAGVTAPMRGRSIPREASVGGYQSGLGADEMSETDWRAALLKAQREVAEWQRQWVENDKRLRYMQMAATLSIPLAGAIWKLILGRRRVTTGTE